MTVQKIDKQIISLPEGYTLRPATLADAQGVADALNAYDDHVLGTSATTAEELRVEWQTPGFNLADDVRVVTAPTGQIVGMQDVFSNSPHESAFIWGRTHPAHWDVGVEEALLDWATERAMQIVDKAPEGVKTTIGSVLPKQDEVGLARFESMGMSQKRVFSDMAIRFDADTIIPSPQWAEGITIKTMQPGQERAVSLAVNESFKDHWGHVDRPIEEVIKRDMHRIENDPSYDPTLWFLAMDGDQIAGFSLCKAKSYNDPKAGLVDTLGVIRSYRRKGIALALLHHSFTELKNRGKAGVMLDVDAGSLTNATLLYEKAGMDVKASYLFYEKTIRAGEDIKLQTLD